MDVKKKLEALSRQELLAGLSQTELEQLAHVSIHRKVGRYQFIFMPDEPVENVYFLLKGRVKIGTFAVDGREVIKEVISTPQLFGEMGFAGENIRTDYAVAMHDEAEFLAIRVSDFSEIMQRNPRIMMACMQHLKTRLQRVESRLASLVLKDARERIIDFLVDSADREGRRVGFETLVKHYLTQQEIANLTGTSRQTVTSVLNDLRKSNLIHFSRNSILIRDLHNLV